MLKPSYEAFKVTIEDKVAHIQMNRPEAMNTMNKAFWNELPEIVRTIDQNALARHRHLLHRQALLRRHGHHRLHRPAPRRRA